MAATLTQKGEYSKPPGGRAASRGQADESTAALKWGMADARTPFDSVESSLEYIGLLREVIAKTRKEVEANAATASAEGEARGVEALRLVLYKLERLDKHMEAVHRNLNDLRTLRRLLLHERERGAGEGGA
jgi:hypothetical protein